MTQRPSDADTCVEEAITEIEKKNLIYFWFTNRSDYGHVLIIPQSSLAIFLSIIAVTGGFCAQC